MTSRKPRSRVRSSVLGAALGLFAASTLWGASSGAQSAGASIAEQLFLEGRALMAEQKVEAACEKFRAAYDLDRSATGTLLNLALCNEALGRTATAWAQFRQVAAQSLGRREDRVTLAREHEQALFPALSRVTILVPEPARAPGLSVSLDGRPIDAAAWGTEIPVDPGPHVLEASAPGRLSIEQRFELGPSADRRTVEVPVLTPEAPTSPTPPDTTASPPPPDVVAPRAASPWRTAGYVAGGLGLASLGVGAIFGVLAANRNSDAEGLCPGNVCPDVATKNRASDQLSAADDAARVANVTVIAGLVLVAFGAVSLVATGPSRATTKPSAGLSISPLAATGTGGVNGVALGGWY